MRIARIPGSLLVLLLLTAGGGAAFTLISVKDEIAIGQQAQEQVRAEVPQLNEDTVAGYVRDLGTRLAAHAPGPEYPYSFTVADYQEINAFALPGGPVWINRGLIDAAQNEAQLVSVIAHEVAHIAQRHSADQMTRHLVAEGVLGVLGALIGGETGGARAAQIAARVAAGGYLLRYSRDHEREADQVGAEIMHRAGWDPRGAVEFMRILHQEMGRNPTAVEVWLSSHPSPEDRVERLEEVSRRLNGGRRDSERFAQAQRRLAALPPARPMPRR